MALPSNLQGELFELFLIHSFRPLLKKQPGHMPTARLGGPWGGENVAAGDGFAREDDWSNQAASA
jgi:hypothetical protein